MKEVRYERAADLKGALALAGKENRRLLAGGTNLLLKMKHGMLSSVPLLDISRIEELNYIEEEGQRIRIGSCTKLDQLLDSSVLQKKAHFLLDIVREIGSPEVRNMGTAGGNLCSARANCGTCFLPGCRGMSGDRSVLPCRNAGYADLLLPLAAYGASFLLRSAAGERTVPARAFIGSDGSLDLKKDEIMTEIAFGTPRAEGWGYARLRQPESMGLPFACVITENRGSVVDLTVGGSMSGLRRFEARSPDEGADEIVESITFNDSLLFSPEYLKRVLASLVREAVRKALEGSGMR